MSRYDGTIKLHFTSAKRGIAASVDNSVTAGEKTKSGRTKTWIAHVVKAFPCETAAQASKRIAAT